MWNGSGWYGFIGTISTSTTDISLLGHQLARFWYLSHVGPAPSLLAYENREVDAFVDHIILIEVH